MQQQEKRVESTEMHRKWRQHSGARRELVGMGAEEMPWSSRPDTQLRGLPNSCPRVEDVINVVWGDSSMRQGIQEDFAAMQKWRENLFADISQNVSRVKGTRGIGTLVQGSTLYSYEHDAVLTFTQLLQLMGFPAEECDMTSMSSNAGKQKRAGLFGEAFSLPCCTLVLAALVTNPHAHVMQKPGARSSEEL